MSAGIDVPPSSTIVVTSTNIVVTLPLSELVISTPISLPQATVGVPYHADLAALCRVCGGTKPYHFRPISGFPGWSDLTDAGVLLGTPKGTANYTLPLSFSVTDSGAVPKTMLVHSSAGDK